MKCPQCNHENGPGDKFCEQCGSALDAGGPASVAATQMGGQLANAALTDSDGVAHHLGGRVMVGRLDTCDIPINDKSVSREHARLSQLPGGYVVEDLHSTNGTMVNGQRIHEAVILRPGDTVTFGSVEFLFGEESAARSVPEPAAPQRQVAQEAPAPPSWAAPSAPAETPSKPAQSDNAHQEPSPAIDFPPLQPFSPFPQPEHAPAVNSAPPEPKPQPAATGSFSSPVQPQEATESEQPPEPVPWREEPAAPEPSAETAGAGLTNEVMETAARLTTLVRELAQQVDDAESRRTQTDRHLEQLEGAGVRLETVREILGEAPQSPMSQQQLQSMQGILDQLIQNPRDIELLMQVGRQASDLAAVVNEYDQLRRLLQRAISQAEATG